MVIQLFKHNHMKLKTSPAFFFIYVFIYFFLHTSYIVIEEGLLSGTGEAYFRKVSYGINVFFLTFSTHCLYLLPIYVNEKRYFCCRIEPAKWKDVL